MFFFLRPKYLLQVLSILLLQYGCTPILYVTGDIKKLKYEDSIAVKSFVLNEKAKYNTLFVAKDEKNLVFFTDTIVNHLPAILIFNKDQVNVFADRTCPWSTIRYLDSLNDLKNDTSIMISKKVTVQKLLAPLAPIAGVWPDEKTLSQYDYFIFYTWAKFVPKLSKKMINDVNKFEETNSNRVFIGAINLDLQQSWIGKTASSRLNTPYTNTCAFSETDWINLLNKGPVTASSTILAPLPFVIRSTSETISCSELTITP